VKERTEEDEEQEQSEEEEGDDEDAQAETEEEEESMAAVKVVRELWGPAPGKGIKAEGVNSQRWYDVQVRCEGERWTQRVVSSSLSRSNQRTRTHLTKR
jgi:hypothetical protein